MKNKTIARAVARHASEDTVDFVALWSVGLWLAALIYLLATLDVLH